MRATSVFYPITGLLFLFTSFAANAGSSPPPCQPYPACNNPHEGAGSLVVEGVLMWGRDTVNIQHDAFRIGKILMDKSSSRSSGAEGLAGNQMSHAGMAAGDGFAFPYSVWGGFSHTDSSSDFSTTAFDSSRYSFLGGADFSPREGLVMGLALGYEDQEVDTFFNFGEMDADGYTIAPYIAMAVGDQSSFDLTFGYSDIDISQFRSAGGVAGGARISSKVGSERYFVSSNFTTFRDYGEWHVTTQLGVSWAKDKQDAFTESNGTVNARSNFKLGQAKVGAEVARAWGAFEPYASATLEYDFSRTDLPFAAGVARPKYDPADVLIGFGVRYFATDGLSGSLGYSRVFGRENYDESNLQLMVRAEF